MLPILPRKLERLIQRLPRQQRRVARLLARGGTYRQAAVSRGLHLRTVRNYMRQVRLRRPDVYAAVVEHRTIRLAERHAAALARRAERTRQWCFSQSRRRYRDAEEGRPFGKCGWILP